MLIVDDGLPWIYDAGNAAPVSAFHTLTFSELVDVAVQLSPKVAM